ncbi:3-phosphoglycerate dehydrogenase family protein [Eubacteriales bacterium OttesenSCG-928-G02]|nr:3-phosphoglycerate dehydrogenase family protein [Eubacteriales bacterium OttesenSCG-928-G02]
MNIKLFNKISNIGLDQFDKSKYQIGEDLENYDGVLVRSAKLHDIEFSKDVKAIARAGAGYNNIPIEKCSAEGIVVFNTPGANANGVKELAIAALLLASRDIVSGVNWASSLKGEADVPKLVEKGKSQFAGPELKGKTLGVLGLGATGGRVANAAYGLDMKVVGYDPYITVNAAWGLSRAVQKANSYDEVFAQADYIAIHALLTDETRNLINKDSIAKMKDGVRIVNLSRAELVNNDDIKAALESGKVATYVTDFPTEDLLNVKNIVTIPHLAASTPEAEENCAQMAATQLIEFLEEGNIVNSVNYPNIHQPRNGKYRIVILHKNVPTMLAQISTVLSSDKVNIDSMINRSRDNYAVSIFDTDDKVSDKVIEDITKINDVIRVISI